MKKCLILLAIFIGFCSTNLFAAKNLYLSYSKIPTKIYQNQRFEIKIEALVTTNDFTKLETKFLNQSEIELLNPESAWQEMPKDKYENTYYFKVKSANFTLPDFEVLLFNNSELIDSSILFAPEVSFSNIGKSDSRFSNIIAENLIIKAYKTKQYNNDDVLTIIDIDAINSNLKDFQLQNIKEQGISSFKIWENIENLVYYFVTPVFQKDLIFTYFNTIDNRYHEVKIPLILQNELVSTQTDLNPNDSTFEQYKKMAAIIIFVLFLLLFIWKRNKIFFFFMLVTLIAAVLYNFPNEEGYIKEGAYIYILPTKNSTIFFQVDTKEKVEALEKRENFIKVLGIDREFIGWIKEESFEKN